MAGSWCNTKGRVFPPRKAPPRPGLLRPTFVVPSEGSEPKRSINGAGGRCDTRLATLETGELDRDLSPHKYKAQQHKIPTARQRALWENVQQGKLRGFSLREMARELGIHRNTVRKYSLAESPPLRSILGATGKLQPEKVAPTLTDIFADQLGGHIRWTTTQLTEGFGIGKPKIRSTSP